MSRQRVLARQALIASALVLAMYTSAVEADSTVAPPSLNVSSGSAPNRFAQRYEVYTYVSGNYSVGMLLQVQTTVGTGALGIQNLSASVTGYVEAWTFRGLQCSVAITAIDPNSGNVTMVVGIPVMSDGYSYQYRSCRVTLSGASANVAPSDPVNIRANVTGPVIAQTDLVCDSCQGY
jgi:hypothetical protein